MLARVAKLFLKILFALLLLCTLSLALVHTPALQRKITVKISDYLSERTGGEIRINEINFSIIPGRLKVHGLEIKEPSQQNVLSVDQIILEFNLIGIIVGDFIFENAEVHGIKGQLIHNKEELNLQFLLDAFSTIDKAVEPIDEVSRETRFQFKNIAIQDVQVKFHSFPNNFNFQSSLGCLNIEGVFLNFNPNKLKVDVLSLENTHSSLITYEIESNDPGVSIAEGICQFPALDFNSGFDIEIGNLKVKDNSFLLHVNESLDKQRSDLNTIDASGIQIELADILINRDTISAKAKQIAADLSGFSLQDFQMGINIGNKALDISDLNLATNNSKLKLDLDGTFNHFPNLINELDQAIFQLSLAGHLHQADLDYFLGDSTISQIRNWSMIQLAIDTRYESGYVNINKLGIGVGNSRIKLKGTLSNLMSGQHITWENLAINASIGKDIKESLSRLIPDFNPPSSIQLRFISSGNFEEFDLAGQVLTSWGNVRSRGSAGFNQKGISMNMTHVGDNIRLGDILDLSWMGTADFSLKTEGQIGDNQEIEIDGLVNRIDLFDQTISDTHLRSRILDNSTSANIIIEDPDYRSKIETDISFQGPIDVSGNLSLDQFNIGKLIRQDTNLMIGGDLKVKILMDELALQGFLDGHDITLDTKTIHHELDSMNLAFKSTAESSSVKFQTDNIDLTSKINFDFKEIPEVIQVLLNSYFLSSDSVIVPTGNRNMGFDLTLHDASILKLMKPDIKYLGKLTVGGEFNERDQVFELKALTRGFDGYGISLDSMDVRLIVSADSLSSGIFVHDLHYDSTRLGNLKLDAYRSDTTYLELLLMRDSVYLIALNSRLTHSGDEFYLFMDSLILFDDTYNVESNDPILINDDMVSFNQFQIDHEETEVSIDGDLNKFDLNVRNIELERFNTLITDTVINSGILNSTLSYSKAHKQINMNLNVDSLTIYDYPPMHILAMASNEDFTIPFQFNLNSTNNNIGLQGEYNFDNSEIEGSLILDIDDLEVFEIMASQYLEKMQGRINGEATIQGNVKEPKINGSLRLLDIRLFTANPKAIVEVRDEVIHLDNSGISFNNFTLYDQVNNPLTVNGFIRTNDYQSFEYNLDLTTGKYILINSPTVNENNLQGILVIGSDINMSGNSSGTFISANILIKDSTDLSYILAARDIELISSEGIVEFIDPSQSIDTMNTLYSQLYNDSLITILPKFNLKSNLILEETALLRLIIDPRSGDFIEVTGTADLQIDVDRTGNPRIAGNYTIKNGNYHLSFYDIVKKEFRIAPGSNILWNGNPKTGKINLTALHTINTSSIGLIGHEVSENEKAFYRRTLSYEVSIIISGFIDNPQVSFGLDLPQVEKNNFPALANKLNILKQPEYESELIKQVFGLLVFGGFIPEPNGSDIDQSFVATTAISNSVNGILANQLNRFVGKYVKGVEIDVGLQSYSDFTTGAGQTRTAMDVRVSKRIMDDRLGFEIGGGMDVTTDQSGPNTGSDNFRGDVAIFYDLTESGNKKLKAFNNETYDIIYHQVRNTGISLIFIKEFDKRGE